MKKRCYFIAAIMLGLFSSVSFAASVSFYATTGSSTAPVTTETPWDYKRLIANSADSSKDFKINYILNANWVINSAKLWLLAVDDINNTAHCGAQGDTGATTCGDGTSSPLDGSEKAIVSVIEGVTGSYNIPLEIDKFVWYDLGIDVKNKLSNADKVFTGTVKAFSGDFWYKNAKIEIDYSLKPVPVPAAIWLFGPVLLGLTGLRRKLAIK